jgi:FKBP-type peptidyl-prolyl cis-trans isomerase
MKHLQILSLLLCVTIFATSCDSLGYKKTPSGLRYKIFSGGSKDSTKEGDALKMNVTQRITGHIDTSMSTYGKMPSYVKIQTPPPGQPMYGPEEILSLLRKGDSVVTVLFVDSLIKKGIVPEAQLPEFLKKGDKITISFKVLEVFKNDSLGQADYAEEMKKDAPRQQKEQEEMMNKMKKEQEAARQKEIDSLKKVGAIDKMEQEVADFLKSKGINAIKTPLGTFVKIDNVGTGAPVTDGKFVTAKYTGKKILADSTFESNSFTMPIGKGGSIPGFEDGLRQFKEGGKGTIYIPGYLAYGKNNPSIFKPYEALSFDVEITKVSDTNEPPPPPPASKVQMKQPIKKK